MVNVNLGKRSCGSLAIAVTLSFALVMAAGVLAAMPEQAHAASTVTCKVSGEVNYTGSYKFLKKLNKLRKQKGVRPLVMDKKLLKVAEQRAAETSILSAHKRPNGKMCNTVSKLLKGENLAAANDYEGAFTWWKNSPGHYRNMIRSSFSTAGIACFERNGQRYWTNLFGTSKTGKVKKSGAKSKSFKVRIAKKYLKGKYMTLAHREVESYSSTPVTILFGMKGVNAAGSLPNSLFTYKSSNPAVFTVDSKGVIRASGEGSAKLTITAKKKKSCKLTQTVRVVDFLDDGAFMAADD